MVWFSSICFTLNSQSPEGIMVLKYLGNSYATTGNFGGNHVVSLPPHSIPHGNDTGLPDFKMMEIHSTSWEGRYKKYEGQEVFMHAFWIQSTTLSHQLNQRWFLERDTFLVKSWRIWGTWTDTKSICWDNIF